MEWPGRETLDRAGAMQGTARKARSAITPTASLALSVAGHLLLGRHHVFSDPQSPLRPRRGSNRSATFNGITAKAHSTGFLSPAPAKASPSLCEGPFSNSDGTSGRGTAVSPAVRETN